jgi:DUF1365 family protein
MNAIYTGHVAHRRPGKHRLRYSVFMLALDLDDLPRSSALFAHNRTALVSLHDRDHAGRLNAPLKPQIEGKLHEAGIVWDGGRIVLLTMPRLFNYVFNPLSVYFCYRRDGMIAALVHEVSNTFGETHFYVLPAKVDNAGRLAQRCTKEFFVSPFLESGLTYEFAITPPGQRAAVAMTVRRGDEVALTASFAGERRAFTDANLLSAWLGNPLMTFKVIAGIHWEALKMWLKGVRYLGRGRTAAFQAAKRSHARPDHADDQRQSDGSTTRRAATGLRSM